MRRVKEKLQMVILTANYKHQATKNDFDQENVFFFKDRHVSCDPPAVFTICIERRQRERRLIFDRTSVTNNESATPKVKSE